MPHVEIAGLRKSYASVQAVKDISFSLNEGELLTLLGPSGCGKTTTLDIIAGLTEPDEGDIVIDGENVNGQNPENRDTVKVFQEYALFPHMTVGKNIGFGLKMAGVNETDRKARIREALSTVELNNLENREINELSGGQRQRVATARALVKEPSVLLLDEPFSALDLKLREQLQIELKKLQESLGITTIHVTHNQEEAMTLSDKIVVMNDGEKSQEGSPSDVYESPNSRFVADFMGKSNIIPSEIVSTKNGHSKVSALESDLVFQDIPIKEKGLTTGDETILCIRPEKCEISPGEQSMADANMFEGRINQKFVLGSIVQYRFDGTEMGLAGEDFIVEDKNLNDHHDMCSGDTVNVYCRPDSVSLLRT